MKVAQIRPSTWLAFAWAGAGLALLTTAIVQGTGFRGYDLDTHVFFASHYLAAWWTTWEPRWYGGFDVVSYPPLAHQLLALLIRALGRAGGAETLSLLLAVAFPFAVWRFASIFVERDAAIVAGGSVLVLPAFGLLLVSSGQLPGILSLELLLASVPEADEYLRSGRTSRLAAFALGVAASAAAHHATPVLFGPFAGAAVIASQPLSRRVWPRTAAAVAAAGAASLAVMWPFWLWWLQRPVQAPIDHISRHSILAGTHILLTNLLLPYSIWLLVLPVAALSIARRKLAGLSAAAVLVFVLSLGGTTPLPEWLYRSNWTWLTYERYSLWCGVLLAPLAGWLLVQLTRRLAPTVLVPALTLVGLVAAASTAVATWQVVIQPSQPPPLDPRPVVDFLSAPDRQSWRYLTLGLGDQLAWVGSLVSAPTIDGDYNSARRDPLLLNSGIDKLDSIGYWDPDAKALRAYLQDPGRSSLRWVLANTDEYDGILAACAWRRDQVLANGVTVWVPKTIPPPLMPEPAGRLTFAAAWWGCVPLMTFTALLLTGMHRLHSAETSRSQAGCSTDACATFAGCCE